MKAVTLTILFSILTLNLTFSQTECQMAAEKAKFDFNNSDFSFHSLELLPVENTYFYVLEKYYNINWYFTDSLNFYKCYDSIMTSLLERKFGEKFLERAKAITDSLENSLNWRKEAQFSGGQKELFKFLSSHLIRESIKVDSIRTKHRLYVQFEIDTTGQVINPLIMIGINRKIDKKVITVVKQFPNWEPAYLYGKPIRQRYGIPINLDYE